MRLPCARHEGGLTPLLAAMTGIIRLDPGDRVIPLAGVLFYLSGDRASDREALL